MSKCHKTWQKMIWIICIVFFVWHDKLLFETGRQLCTPGFILCSISSCKKMTKIFDSDAITVRRWMRKKMKGKTKVKPKLKK